MAELQEVEILDIPISEMTEDMSAVIPLDPDLVASLIEGDDKDIKFRFPIIRVESGVSKNKFEWTPEQLVDIAEQVNTKQPNGYLGHIKPDEERYAFPMPQTRWLKAVTKEEGGKTVLYVKGFNIPDEPIRKYIKTKAVDSTSWHGKAAVQHLKGGVQRVVEFALESIDWSRKGKSAMSAKLVTVAAEQEGKEETDVELSKVTVAEIEAENPNLVVLIKSEARAEADKEIAEMEEKVKVADESTTVFQKMRELLGIDESADILEAVGKIQKRLDDIGKKNVRERVLELLKSKIKDDDARNTVLRLLPVNEMSEDLDEEGLKKRVDECFDTDNEIKTIVNRLGNGGGPLKNKTVDEMEGNGKYESGKSTGNVKVTRTKL